MILSPSYVQLKKFKIFVREAQAYLTSELASVDINEKAELIVLKLLQIYVKGILEVSAC
jgi:hypothetical protein